MSEPQHPQPQPQDTDTNEGHPAPVARAVVQPVEQPGPASFDSLAAVGARLTQLRELKGWTIEDVSARLKVSVTKLRALESGDISHLPDTTFALGVVRSYAKMLGADPTPFTQALRREKGVPAPDLSMPASSGKDLPRGRVSLSLGGSGQKSRSWLWGIAAIIVAVIALGMWHTNGGDSSAWLARLKASANGAAGGATGASGAVAQGQPAGSEATAEDAASAPEAQAATDNAASGTPMPAPLATGEAPSPAPAVTAAAVAPKAGSQVQAAAQGASAPVVAAIGASAAADTAAPAAGEAIIALRVTQDSWFSVRGKDGKEVFSGLVHAGDTKEVTGAAPFKVTVGNKAGLESLTLDGQPVDPSKYSAAKGNVARFALP
ncbi:Cytoskeleton protein RodZ [Paraburkholderia aspalathi]|uniref:Cytoskeleton protein RodZ n=1 Tax=Paraburkholderia aspalathi TaxID=1324617 RepID=A0A1I7AF02_9BURK|nr:helix-turn-helix domain-containing protein [Paraburkholderia aspalathi]MBK3817051.1 helix-turn-helix domain-containing protein [Paraburkholderia aspalathi]MBK3828903.1 helix-turn-helix domain-containing protein [Paraburkholderia aspalathi]MBK3858588.1 helix-turn-helix domain-containing protein [Paraburkholderia aspalathi]CAE6703094.1 Cytoskeleton protein RodZ [Paraburkholderia aspalathi]SFT73468.1 transcriptional regulator, XRE family [Paraburkholderia aspalathi]